MDFVKEHAAADGGDLRMSILTSEWEKTESDLDNRTGKIAANAAFSLFLADHIQKHLMDLPVAVEFRMESNCDLISIAYTDDMVIDY